jgi:thiol-disulfide isomerase/thioredoxin
MYSWFRLGAVCALLGCGGSGAPEGLTVGTLAPEFSLPALDGTQVESRSLLGREIVLVFWATWCQPCLREIPVWKELTLNGVEVVAVALDEEGQRAVAPFVERHEIPYTVLLGNQEIFQRFDGLSIPYTLLLDGSQQVVNLYRGPVTQESIEQDLAMLEESV